MGSPSNSMWSEGSEEEESAVGDREKDGSVVFHDLVKTNVGSRLCQGAWQPGLACNASPDAKLTVLVLIHHLQRVRPDSPGSFNHPQTHLEVITTVINSYINQMI